MLNLCVFNVNSELVCEKTVKLILLKSTCISTKTASVCVCERVRRILLQLHYRLVDILTKSPMKIMSEFVG